MADKNACELERPKKKRSRDFNYFEAMTKMSECAVTASEFLKSLIMDLNDLTTKKDEIHKIESESDSHYHSLIEALNKAFITPLEREDIKDLAHAVDEVVDTIEDVVLRLYMFNVTDIRPEAVEFTDLICEISKTLNETMIEFENCKKSKKIGEYIVKLNHLEEDGDRIYVAAMRSLFTCNAPNLEVLKWKEIFDIMEHCCDACECCADMIEGVMLKNS